MLFFVHYIFYWALFAYIFWTELPARLDVFFSNQRLSSVGWKHSTSRSRKYPPNLIWGDIQFNFWRVYLYLMYVVQYVNKTNCVIHFELLKLAARAAQVEGRKLKRVFLAKFDTKLLDTVKISGSQESRYGIG